MSPEQLLDCGGLGVWQIEVSLALGARHLWGKHNFLEPGGRVCMRMCVWGRRGI